MNNDSTEKRAICVICKKKRNTSKIRKVENLNVCNDNDECANHPDIEIIQKIQQFKQTLTILNLNYAQ